MQDKFLKLTNAVYKILDFFPEGDPIKNRAKDRALAIMEHLVLIIGTRCPPNSRQGWATLADTFMEEKIKVQLSEDIDVLLGYLWIGKTQGWLNSVNCLVITNEYEKIKKEILPIEGLTQGIPAAEEPNVQPDCVLENSEVEDEWTSTSLVDSGKDNVDISDRQKKIIEFLNKNNKAQVMDLQKLFPDITKRTIRRDLDDLLVAGMVVRQGDFNQVFYRIKGSAEIGQNIAR